MHAPTITDLLSAWEQGSAQPPVQRALTLLTAAGGDASREDLAALNIGERDARLLALRERMFGPRMKSLATCPACGLQVQLDFDVAEIRVAAPPEAVDAATVRLGNCDATFRLPNSRDLAALTPESDAASDGRALLERCVVLATRDGHEIAVEQMPAEMASAISQRMAEVDPQADVQLALTCPQCSGSWHAPLDIASFLWSEVHAWAVRLLREVHTLASAYGWREADILALSPWRRHVYLEMVAR